MKKAEGLEKFLLRVSDLIATLMDEKNAFLQRGVDPYYYIRKKEELQLLKEASADATKKVEEATQRLRFFNEKLDENYRELFNAWRKDVHWVSSMLRDQPNSGV